jgi:nucleoside-diphosphate-sugar epimerase
MSKVLLIGGEGYIGSYVSRYLISKDYKVISYDNLIYKNNANVVSNIMFNNFSFIKEDMANINHYTEMFKDIDCVVLLAGLVGDPITMKYPEKSILINENYMKICIDFFSQLNVKLIFISTCSNYGLRDNNIPAIETDALNPLSSYARSKVEIEKYVLSKKLLNSKFKPIIFRFSTAFGLSPRMRFDLTVNQFTKEIFYNNQLDIYDCDTWRPYCHVSDFASVIEQSFEKLNNNTFSYEIFNVGIDKNNQTKKNIASKIVDHFERGEINYVDNDSDKRNYIVNFDKLKNHFDVSNFKSLSYGINEISEVLSLNLFDNSSKYGNFDIE